MKKSKEVSALRERLLQEHYQGRGRARHLVQGLGLKTANGSKSHVKFHHPDVTALQQIISALAYGLPKDHAQLCLLAQDKKSTSTTKAQSDLSKGLNRALDDLGETLWGRHTDRSHLLDAQTNDTPFYIRTLFYPDDSGM